MIRGMHKNVIGMRKFFSSYENFSYDINNIKILMF